MMMMAVIPIVMILIISDDDDITLGMPETQKWKNVMFFTTHTFPITYHSTFRLDSFFSLFLSLKVK